MLTVILYEQERTEQLRYDKVYGKSLGVIHKECEPGAKSQKLSANLLAGEFCLNTRMKKYQ